MKSIKIYLCLLWRCLKSKLFVINKNNIKGIWNMLNSVSIIRNSFSYLNYPEYFSLNKQNTDNMNVVVNSFNKFFVSVSGQT